MKISDEAMAAAKARYAEMWGDGDIDRAGEQMLTDVLEASGPVIAAQALIAAAEDVRDNDDAHSHGDRCSYGPPGQCDCDRGATFRWLISRAVGRCGAADPHGGVDACHLPIKHNPDLGHRYGPVEQLPEQCCAEPNMVWEHSRDNKDHFRCACGGGMTKARATS